MRASDNEQGINKLWPYINLRINLRLSVILNTSNKMVFEMILQMFSSQPMYSKNIQVKTKSSYNPIITSFLAVVIAPVPFLF